MTRTEEQLDRLYAQIPSMHCRGLCWDSCGPIDMSEFERRRLADRGFAILPAAEQLEQLRRHREVPACSALSALGACRVYDVRPLICRAYGAIEGLACAHGCSPPSRALTRTEFSALLREVNAVSDGAVGVDGPRERRRAAHEQHIRSMRELLARGAAGTEQRGGRR